MEIRGEHSVASGRAITNFMDTASRSLQVETPHAQIAIHRPLAGRAGALQDEGDGFEPGDDAGMSEADAHNSKRQHRVRKADFPAGADNGAVIPPDTQGTVGPNHLMAVLNSNVTIETRTGVVLSSIPIASFWSSLGGINEAFDPRVLFDRYADRWIISAGANAASPTAYILIGVSQTNDPTGAWNLYKVSLDANGASWADYPTLGFNGDWIVLQTNVFTVEPGRVSRLLHLRIRQSRLVRRRRRPIHGVPRSDWLYRLSGSDPRQHAGDRVPGEKLERRQRDASRQHDHRI